MGNGEQLRKKVEPDSPIGDGIAGDDRLGVTQDNNTTYVLRLIEETYTNKGT